MSPVRISGALLEKLGEPAAHQLRDVLEAQQDETMEAVMSQCAERFERRLVQEISALRVEMSQGFAGIRRELADGRVDLLKWSFLFWVGQVVAIVAIVGALTASMRR